MKVSYSKALSLLKSAEPVAIPTETVYGLAGRIDSEAAIQKIFQLKNRPAFDPLIVHCLNKKQALLLCSKKILLFEKLLDHFTPGPLTLVVPKHKSVSPQITAGKTKLGIRIPQHPLTRQLLKDLKVPLAAPSANPYGKVSPVKAEHVLSAFQNKVPVLDGGTCKKGIESTLLELGSKTLFLLRPGLITKKDLEIFLEKEGLDYQISSKKSHSAPGGGDFHYQPLVPFYILESSNNKKLTKKEILDFFSKTSAHKKIQELKIFPSSKKTAQLLYSQWHDFSKDKNNLIYVRKEQLKKGGLWDAINNRIQKASSKTIVIKK